MQADSIREQADSLEFRLPELRINATRNLHGNPRRTAAAANLGRREMLEFGAHDVPGALQFVPGVFIRNYGGLGGLKSISLRGTASSQTLILLDGMRLNSAQNGQYDLGVLDFSLVEELEVDRGGAAALYGANALGGIVNIRTARSVEQTHVAAGLYGASFGEYGMDANVRLPLAPGQLQVGAAHVYGEGVYPFVFNQFGVDTTLHRHNADFRNITTSLAYASHNSRWNWQARSLFRQTERGIPGEVVQGNAGNNGARLHENEVFFSAGAECRLSGNSLLKLNSGYRHHRYEYRDPELFDNNGNIFHNEFFGNDLNVAAVLSTISSGYFAELRSELQFADLYGTALQPEQGEYVRRYGVSVAGRLELDVPLDSLLALSCRTALRCEHFSVFGTVLSPLQAFSLYHKGWQAALRLQWSYDYRPPTFNELYYLNFGNSNLQAERAHSINVGLSYELNNTLAVDVDGFAIYTRNLIVSVPNTPVSWSARNVGRALSRGLEAAIRAVLLNDKLSARFSYTRQTATNESKDSPHRGKDIVYVPRNLLAFSLHADLHYCKLAVNTHFSGKRYSLASAIPESVVDGFWHARAHVEVPWVWSNYSVRMRAEVDNIFDTGYSVINNYPMPGRSLRIALVVQWRDR